MQAPGRGHSRIVSGRLLLALAAVALAAVAVGAALAATQTKKFSASIEQIAQNEYRFTLTNHASSTQPFGSANVTLPEQFQLGGLTGQSVPAGKTWTITRVGQTLELRAQNTKSLLAKTESVTFTLAATAPCGSYTWETRVKQSNNFLGAGNDFQFVPTGDQALDARDPHIIVIGPAASFSFSEISDPQEVDVQFPTTTVTALDGCDRTARFYSGSPKLDGLESATLGSTTTPPSYEGGPLVAGTGSYTVKAVQAQQLATLTAEAGLREGLDGESNEFDVVSEICDGSQNPCRASHGDGTQVIVPPPSDGITTISLSGPGRSFTCGSSTPTPNIGSSVLVVPAEGGYGEPIQVDITWSLLGASGGSRIVCMSKDGVTYAPVARCGRTPAPPCELNRTRSGDLLRAVILIDPEDPSFDLG